MKTIYVKEDIVKEAVAYLNDDITFYGFLSHTKSFLKELLVKPLSADIDDFLKKNGLDRKTLIDLLMDKGILERETKIEDKNASDQFSVLYKIPKRNFERKMRRLYSSLFEKNEISESTLFEDGASGIGGGGATGCNNAMQGGGDKPEAGQFIQPFSKVQRRKIYVTEEQAEMLKEMGTTDAGNYQYDVPMNFNGGNDPAYNHQNMMVKSFPGKKKRKK